MTGSSPTATQLQRTICWRCSINGSAWECPRPHALISRSIQSMCLLALATSSGSSSERTLSFFGPCRHDARRGSNRERTAPDDYQEHGGERGIKRKMGAVLGNNHRSQQVRTGEAARSMGRDGAKASTKRSQLAQENFGRTSSCSSSRLTFKQGDQSTS